MVYIEEQSAYLQQLKQSDMAALLREILHAQTGIHSLETHDANKVAINLIICVKTGNKNDAELILKQFSKRKITRENHWIYDNFIIFAIVCAVHKFDMPSDWIKEVIDLTYSNASLTDKRIKDTFRNILNSNYGSKGDFHQISLVYQYIAKDEKPNEARMNEMYVELWEAPFPFADDNFLNVVSLKAIEIAFAKKAMLSPHDLQLMNQFVPVFKKRAESIARVASRILISVMTLGSFYLLWLLYNKSDVYPLFSKILFFILSISGFGVSILWALKKGLSTYIFKIIKKTFGYPKET
ncbi:hypothetical protein LLH06_08600 [Mucilaginibacter daejeonensis]|uniref:hypothetical protein n=1 Tax=Mucilaginibacter daejeonensis TaxID=398049 RepID=UPI001D170776|nr:hypothetical protein [Mucilaginibacter daejeonensis]UEG55023.1 hypothetical protein LLH06_08600 [Mucilaginibacter daejeonensis]